ncbi:MAG: exodeoxyribonuclease V subunit gamma [Candidatus Binataceae bacterium]
MLKLHYSNRLEGLIEPLAGAIADRQRRDPLRKISIVVPNRAVEQFVKYRVAERLGVAANLAFPFLRTHLTGIAQSAGPRLRVLGASALQLVIFNSLMSESNRGYAKLAPAWKYIDAGGGRGTPEAELRAFELSGRMAKLFEEYSISRRAMLRQWSNDRITISDAAIAETEKWQQTLWRIIFNAGDAANPEWTGDAAHDWMLLPDAFARIDDTTLAAAMREGLHVFGLASPGQAYAEIFARLGKLGALSIYALNPCREFWEDLDTSRRSAGTNWVHRGSRIGGDLDTNEDPFALATADNRALELWGRPGREYIRLLNELSNCDFESNFIDAEDGKSASALSHLQQNILDRSQGTELQDAAAMASIRFLACPGIQREVEIVANEIWRLLKQSASGKNPLRFHEIGVLIPDAECEAYAPHIEAVFARIHGIPVEISGCTVSRQSRVGEAIGLLLKLPLGRFTRADLMRLLKHPALSAGDSKLDLERWDGWCEELGVFFGADGGDPASTYIPSNLFNWDQALKRIALGAFMSGERSGDDRLFDSAAIGALMPLEIDESEIPGAQAFVSRGRALLADANAIRSERLSLKRWAQLLARMIERYIIAAEPDDQRMRDRCLAVIDAMHAEEVESPEVSYAVAEAMVSALIEDLGSHQVRFAGHGVAAGAMGTLHSIPFRAIFVMGLGESCFPARDPRDPLDLRQTRRHAGDLRPTDRDRYLFLESILAAREQIAFSYVARDAHTGDALEPSTVIRELQFILGSYLNETAVDALTLTHPVSRYDLGYFGDLGGAASSLNGLSVESAARRGARVSVLREDLDRFTDDAAHLDARELLTALAPEAREALRRTLRLPKIGEPAGTADREAVLDLPVAALRKFLECPAQGAARYALGMSEDEDTDEEIVDEPVGMTKLDQVMLLREVFWNLPKTDADAKSEYQRAAVLAQMRGHAPVGPIADVLRDQDLDLIRGWSKYAEAAQTGDLSKWKEFRIGRADQRASSAQEILPYLVLKVPVRTARGKSFIRRVRIYGRAGVFSPGLNSSLQCVARKNAKAKHFLPLFLNAIVLKAAGEPIAKEFRAILVGVGAAAEKKKLPLWVTTLIAPERDQAVEYLTELVSDLLSDPHDYFLPIEAAEKVCNLSCTGSSAAEAVSALEEMRDQEGDRGLPSSAYGPLRRWRDLELPSAAEIFDLVNRRFGPIKALFGDEDAEE